MWCGWDREAHRRIISVVGDKGQGKESMMNSVIEAAVGNDLFAASAGDERTFSLELLSAREARTIEMGVQEEAAIEAEDVLTQAEEALVMG